MIVVNDIELIMPLRALGLIKNGFFGISQLYLTENYFEPSEFFGIKELEKNQDLTVFELSNDFYDFYENNHLKHPELAITDISSVYYAEKYQLDLLSRCKHVQAFASKNYVKVCEPIEMLKKLNTEPEKINILQHIISTIITN